MAVVTEAPAGTSAMVAAPGCPSAAATGGTVPVPSAGCAVLPNMSGSVAG